MNMSKDERSPKCKSLLIPKSKNTKYSQPFASLCKK